MSETYFPINDLSRRKLQTGLTIAGLTSCVASTVLLLLFGEKLGFQVSQTAEVKLTSGVAIVLSRFVTFIGILTVITGAVVISFLALSMMSQRVKDIGLMKATGCPNGLIFGHFMTELLIVTFASCILGVTIGIFADFALTSLLSLPGFPISQKPVNPWLALLVFVLFSVLAIAFGARQILATTKVEPAKAISPGYYLGLSKEPGFNVMSKSGITGKIALRSLFRRKSSTVRILLCLATVFTLVTIAVAGGMIANQTTANWVEKAIGRDTILIAHGEMCIQYRSLLTQFSGAKANLQFDYDKKEYSISEDLLNQLENIPHIQIETRLLTQGSVAELPGEIIDPETSTITSVGDNREGTSLIVGVEPERMASESLVEGEYLEESEAWEAMIGDSLAHRMFSRPLNQYIMAFGRIFDVTGVCLDPINRGNVTYVPLETLQNISAVSEPNVAMVGVDSTNRSQVLDLLKKIVYGLNPDFDVLELKEPLEENLSFLGYIWSTVMFLPLFSLVAASLCLVSYVVLAISEQSRELGVLRALGMKSKTAFKIVSGQSLVILLSSCGAGTPIGIMITLLILIPDPTVSSCTVLGIVGWLLLALLVMLGLSIYPALKFVGKPILETMNQP